MWLRACGNMSVGICHFLSMHTHLLKNNAQELMQYIQMNSTLTQSALKNIQSILSFKHGSLG
jgi:hypothetical protein